MFAMYRHKMSGNTLERMRALKVVILELYLVI